MTRNPAEQQHVERLAMALGTTVARLEADGARYVRVAAPRLEVIGTLTEPTGFVSAYRWDDEVAA